MRGGSEDFDSDKIIEEDDGKSFFYQKWYATVSLRVRAAAVCLRPPFIQSFIFSLLKRAVFKLHSRDFQSLKNPWMLASYKL